MNAACAQRYARMAGILIVVSLVAGGFGESFVPGRLIVYGDVAETARRMIASAALFRWSFAAYLIEAVCDLTLAVLFYALLRPVNRYVWLLAAFFGLLSTATFASAEIFYYAASIPVLDSDIAKLLSGDSNAVFIYLAFTILGSAFSIFTVFYGIAMVLRGGLMICSGYFPRWLGGVLLLGGTAFLVKNFVVVLNPRFDSPFFALPVIVAMICLASWLLAKGVDRDGWNQLETRQIP